MISDNFKRNTVIKVISDLLNKDMYDILIMDDVEILCLLLDKIYLLKNDYHILKYENDNLKKIIDEAIETLGG
jgi:hypothetical protein